MLNILSMLPYSSIETQNEGDDQDEGTEASDGRLGVKDEQVREGERYLSSSMGLRPFIFAKIDPTLPSI